MDTETRSVPSRLPWLHRWPSASSGTITTTYTDPPISARPSPFPPDSVWDNSNPWMAERARRCRNWRAEDADILFLAGTDWLVMDEGQRQHPPRPVINFIQGVRHARPGDVRHQFLRHPAIRICASDEIAAALRDLGTVRGPIHTIVYGLD